MSIDLDVIPGSHRPVRWGDLRYEIQSFAVSNECRQIIGNVVDLVDSKKRTIQEDEALSCPGYYYFEFAHDTTLSLSVEPTTGGQEDVDYIDDFGRNLRPEFKEFVRRIWESAGFLLTLTSNGGRPKGELDLMAQIASSIAKLTNGYVVVQDDNVFHRPFGIYSCEEF